jgi:hypothetical protein
MNRLRDMDTDEPAFRRGVEVLRETPPTPQAPDMKQRVWRSIRRASATPAPRGFRTLAVRLAMVVSVCLGAGTAGAVITRRWIVPALDEVPSATPPSTPLPARADKTAPVPAPVATAAAAATATEAVDERRISKSPSRSAPKKAAAVPLPSAAAVARERTEVLDALVALRREHDPVRAGALLTRYLAAHPHGALREEALVLAIEAADARRDTATAQQLAQTYQTEFPAGRFVTFARSHTGVRHDGEPSKSSQTLPR